MYMMYVIIIWFGVVYCFNERIKMVGFFLVLGLGLLLRKLLNVNLMLFLF